MCCRYFRIKEKQSKMHVSEYSQYTPSHHTTAATRSHKPTTNVGNVDLACR